MAMRLTYKKSLTVRQVTRAAQLLNLPTPIVNEEKYYVYINKEIYEAYAKYTKSITKGWETTSYMHYMLTNAERIIADICGVYRDKIYEKEEATNETLNISKEQVQTSILL